MRTAYTPKSHEEIATASAGVAFGHVPGHRYHDVDIVVSRGRSGFRCHVVESWGSAQGYDEEHGRREAVGRGASIDQAIQEARDRCRDMCAEHVETAFAKLDSAIEDDAD